MQAKLRWGLKTANMMTPKAAWNNTTRITYTDILFYIRDLINFPHIICMENRLSQQTPFWFGTKPIGEEQDSTHKLDLHTHSGLVRDFAAYLYRFACIWEHYTDCQTLFEVLYGVDNQRECRMQEVFIWGNFPWDRHQSLRGDGQLLCLTAINVL